MRSPALILALVLLALLGHGATAAAEVTAPARHQANVDRCLERLGAFHLLTATVTGPPELARDRAQLVRQQRAARGPCARVQRDRLRSPSRERARRALVTGIRTVQEGQQALLAPRASRTNIGFERARARNIRSALDLWTSPSGYLNHVRACLRPVSAFATILEGVETLRDLRRRAPTLTRQHRIATRACARVARDRLPGRVLERQRRGLSAGVNAVRGGQAAILVAIERRSTPALRRALTRYASTGTRLDRFA